MPDSNRPEIDPFRTMFNQACVGMAQARIPERRLICVNPAFCAITGYSAAELLEMTIDQLNHPEDEEHDRQQFNRLLNGEISELQSEKRYLRKDGRPVWVLVNVNVLRDSDGRPESTWAVVQDVTERKLAQLAAREREEYLQLALAAANAGSWSWYAEPERTEWDSRYHAMYGLPPDELPSKERWIERLHPDDRPRILARLHHILATPGADEWNEEYRVLHTDGRTLWMQGLGRAARDAAGRVVRMTGINLEITKRKHDEEELRRLNLTLEERIIERTREVRLLGQAVAALGEGVLITSAEADWLDSKVVFANQSMCRIAGLAEHELLGCSVRSLHPSRADSETLARLRSELTAGQSGSAEIVCRRRDGSTCEVEVFVTPLSDSAGRFANFVSIYHEISNRKRAQAKIKEQKERLRAILDTVTSAVITIDRNGTMLDVNRAAEKMFEYSAQEMIGDNVRRLMPEPFRSEHDRYLARFQETQSPRVIGASRELFGKRKSGATFPIELAVSAVDHLELFTGVIVDITERRFLQNHVLEIAAEEQRRIGHQLHDGTCQELTGMSMIAGSLLAILDRLPPPNPGQPAVRGFAEQQFQKFRSTCASLCELLRESNHRTQQLSRGIMPVQLDAEGLRSALQELSKSVSASARVVCQFECPKSLKIESNTVATQLYRIAQEAVNNALKHGKASQIRIALAQTPDKVVLTITDNGIGFDIASAPRIHGPGLGLRTMNYRAETIGGRLTVEPGPDGGTVVRCLVLLDDNAPPAR